MPQSSEKYRWLGSYSITILLLFVSEAYVVGRFILKLPATSLLEVMSVFAVIFLAAGPLLYKGRTQAREKGDVRLMTATVTLTFLVLLAMCAYFGARFGLVGVDTARGFIITSMVSVPICGVITYFILKNSTRRFRQKV